MPLRRLITIHHRYGRGAGVGRILGMGLDLGVGLGRGVEVAVGVGVNVGVGVGLGPAAQYLRPVLNSVLPPLLVPPHTIISLPVQTAV
jgi:hypothetical protein